MAKGERELMKDPFWATIIETEYGASVDLTGSWVDARSKAFEYVRDYWEEELPEDEIPEDPDEAVSEYFERVSDETLILAPVTFHFPVVVIVRDPAAYLELVQIIGVEPFEYFNGTGSHWAAFTEVRYRLNDIFNEDHPALRRLLETLSQQGVFGVIVLDEESDE